MCTAVYVLCEFFEVNALYKLLRPTFLLTPGLLLSLLGPSHYITSGRGTETLSMVSTWDASKERSH